MALDSVHAGDDVSLPAESRPATSPRLADLLQRYRIEGPIDDAADREAWQDVAARDVIAEE